MWRPYPVVIMSLSQKDRRVLDAFCEVVGVGKVYGPYDNNGRINGLHSWCISGFERLYAVLGLLWPWLSSAKKEQAAKALATYQVWIESEGLPYG